MRSFCSDITQHLYSLCIPVLSLIYQLTTRFTSGKFHSILDFSASGCPEVRKSLLYLTIKVCRQTIPGGIVRYKVVVWIPIDFLSLPTLLHGGFVQLQSVSHNRIKYFAMNKHLYLEDSF